MKTVAIGVGGRFHSDFMLRAFSSLGYSPKILTSLPKNRFDISEAYIQNCVWPEMIFRLSQRMGFDSWGDSTKMKCFVNFVSSEILKAPSDIFVGWSSFSLETLRKKPAQVHILMRDSSHIQFQYDLLKEEYENFGFRFPNRDFCLKRELEEYELADRIWVLSHFAKKTFIDQGVESNKIDVLPLGVDLKRFFPLEKFPETSPLRVVYFGTLSFRKGVHYLLEATKDFSPKRIELNLIGSIEPEFKSTLVRYSHFNYQKSLPQRYLAQEIRKHHVFVLPTLEDGFGQTLIQAMASGLVPITTTHCGSADFVSLEQQNWRIEPRSSEQIKTQLEGLISSPELFKTLRSQSIREAQNLTWAQYQCHLGHLLSLLPA